MNDNTFVYICFRGDTGKGGLLAERIYMILHDEYNINCYFSSNANRIHGENYREKEIEAFNKATHFFLVLTDDVFSNIEDVEDEVRFELETALNKKIKLLALADTNFKWTEHDKNILRNTFGRQKANMLVYLDYFQFKGVRDIRTIEEKLVKEFLPGSRVNIPTSMEELINILIQKQLCEIETFSASSKLGTELQQFSNMHYCPPRLTKNGIPLVNLSSDIAENLSSFNTHTYFIVGEAGCGKTQLMQKTFKELCCNRKPGSDYLPIYISLNTQKDLECSEKSLLSLILSKYQIPYSDIAINEFSRVIRFMCFFDGIDELQSWMNYTDIVKEMEDRGKGNILVFSGRKSFFDNLYLPPVESLIRIMPLETEDIKKLLLCDDFQIFKRDVPLLIKIVEKHSLYKNMLFLSLIILFYSPDHSLVQDEITVFDLIIRGVLIRELEKSNQTFSEETLTMCGSILMETAFILFSSVRKGQDVSLDTLKKKIAERLSASVDLTLFVFSIFISEDAFKRIHFLHKSFDDFFLAKVFVSKICDNGISDELLELFDYNFNLETNYFITKHFSRDAQTSVDRLREIFLKLPKTKYYAKNQVLNHMNRTGQYVDIYRFAKKQLHTCFNPITKIMLLHSLEATGNEKNEKRYYNFISSNEKRLSLLCGGTLINYEISFEKKELPYYDNGEKTWYPVFLAFKRHIEYACNTPHYYHALRVNLLMAKYYIEKRMHVEPEIANYYFSIGDFFKKDQSAFGKMIMTEYETLIETIKKYQKTSIA